MMRVLPAVLVMTLVFLGLGRGELLAAGPSWGEPGRVLVVVDATDLAGFQAAVKAIEDWGGHVRHAIPPRLAIADLVPGTESSLVGRAGIANVYHGEVAVDSFAGADRVMRTVVMAWNRIARGEATIDRETSSPPLPLIHDVDLRPVDETGGGLPALTGLPYGADQYDTSEFMWGFTGVAVILPESNGTLMTDTEDWTAGEEAQVTSEIMVGLDWWADEAFYPDVSWTYEFHYQVPTGYEPINMSSAQDVQWKMQCLNALGYAHATALTNHLRDTYGTDWAEIVYVVDSSNDLDGMFTDGRFGYSTLGGPPVTMTYDNDGWGISRMDAVMAHETGHVFYALDEYQESGCTCAARSGYLWYENQNCRTVAGCAMSLGNCIMRSVGLATATVCTYTKGHVGWVDTDGDLLPDILDVPPETVINAYVPDPTTDQTPTYTGQAHVVPYPNQNPSPGAHDITVNTVALVEYRVDAGTWFPATAVDGSWDTGTESYTFTTATLDTGTHVIQVRAIDDAGNVDASPASDVLTVRVPTSVGAGADLVAGFWLAPARPNPFRASALVAFSLPAAGEVRLGVYDAQGHRVRLLATGSMGGGEHRVVWDGVDERGAQVPAGIYFTRLEADGKVLMQKMLLAR